MIAVAEGFEAPRFVERIVGLFPPPPPPVLLEQITLTGDERESFAARR